MKRLLLATGAVLCLSGAAHASITPTLVSINPDGSDFMFTYNVTLSGDQGVTDGSQLVIFDFAGFVPGSIVSPSSLITVSTPMTANFNVAAGGVQLNPMFNDDPNIPDLVFTYTGPDFDTTGGPFAPTTVSFTVVSTLGGMTTDGFSSRAISNSGMGTTGTDSFNNGAVGVAAAVAAGAPEPASWALLIMGFGGVGSLIRGRRRRTVQSFA
jgi:hypothetical protein